MHYYGYAIDGFGFFPGLLMLLFWIFIIWLIVEAVRWNRPTGPWHQGQHSSGRALEILKERLAKGEIDKQEFEEKKKLLEQ